MNNKVDLSKFQLFSKMLSGAKSGDCILQGFNLRYTDIAEALIELGWNESCLEFKTVYDGVEISVEASRGLYELSMKLSN